MAGDKPDVGFGFGVEGDQPLLSTIKQLREELKSLKGQHEQTASAADVLSRAWHGLVAAGAAYAALHLAKDVLDTAASLGRLSQATGISSQTLSVYYKAAKDVGIEHEAVDKAVMRLSRSFVQLQAGNSGATAAFRLLNLSAKDFVGLSPDEKLRKVTDAIAGMKDGEKKAAAEQALLGRGGAQLTAMFNQLGAEGFAKVADQARRLGLIMGPELTAAALSTKAAIADLKGTAEGATAQFETGFTPALADMADLIVKGLGQGGSNAFKTLGEYAGLVLKSIFSAGFEVILILRAIGETVSTWVTAKFKDLGNVAGGVFTAMRQAASGDFGQAAATLKATRANEIQIEKDSAAAISGIWDDRAKRRQQFYAELMGDKDRPVPKGGPKKPGDITGAERGEKSTARAEASAIKSAAENELALYRAKAHSQAEIERDEYSRGLLSLTEYFARRRALIEGEHALEVNVRNAELSRLEALRAKTAASPAVTHAQQVAQKSALLKFDEDIGKVKTEIAVLDENETGKLADERREQAKEEYDHQLKLLELQKLRAQAEGDLTKLAKIESDINDLDYRRKARGLEDELQIEQELAAIRRGREISTTATQAKKGFEGGVKGLGEKKSEIQERVASGELAPYQAERLLAAAYAAELPLLQQKIDLLRQQALLAGGDKTDEGKKLGDEAKDEQTKWNRMKAELLRMDTSWQQWKTTAKGAIDQVSHSMTTGLNGWIQGTQRFGQGMKQMWNGLVMTAVTSLEKIAAQSIAHHLKMLLIKQTTNAAGTASDAAAAAAKGSIEKTSGIKSVFKSAKVAAAKAYEAMADIPVIGPVLGAVAAAATFVAVMAFGSFARGGYVDAGALPGLQHGGFLAARSMDHGGMLRGPGSGTSDSIPAMLSNGEYVLNARAVSRIGPETLDMMNRGANLPAITQSAPYTAAGLHRFGSGGQIEPGAGKAGPTFNLPTHIGELNALDGASVRAALEEHGDLIGKIAVTHVKKHFRSGGVN